MHVVSTDQIADILHFNDNTLYVYNKNLENAISYLSQDFPILSNWFYDNYMMLNPGSIVSCCLVSKIMSYSI